MNDNKEFDMEIEKKTPSIIKVIGVGDGGCNAANIIYSMELPHVDLVICNTDFQTLDASPIPRKILLKKPLTAGLGYDNNAQVEKEDAIEDIKEVEKVLDTNTKIVFITAGMGADPATGLAAEIAKIAKERNILTFGLASIPFKIEGNWRINQAIAEINKMFKHVDSLVIIDNEKLLSMYDNIQISNVYTKADEFLANTVKGIVEIITDKGYINIDFEDFRTVMKDSGLALMGSARATGEDRDLIAIEEALKSPLLKDNKIKGCKNVLLNIMSGIGESEITIKEFSNITTYLKEQVSKDANIIWGNSQYPELGEDLRITIIGTGFEM